MSAVPTPREESRSDMERRCLCGNPVRHAFDDLACLDCGGPCCPACAIHLESAAYCRRCASRLLDAETVQAGGPFGLPGGEPMSPTCGCGMTIDPGMPATACTECGTPGCRSCGITIETTTYCRWCATSVAPATA